MDLVTSVYTALFVSNSRRMCEIFAFGPSVWHLVKYSIAEYVTDC